jgi:hypothetical protein
VRVILHVLTGRRAGEQITVVPGESFRIGRASQALHRFPDDQLMSSLHFALDCTNCSCRVRDLKSTNGTFLNAVEVTEADLHDADRLLAGSTAFDVQFIHQTYPAGASAPETREQRLEQFLRDDFQPLYALLDAAREPSVYKVILEATEEHESLYAGARGAQLAHFAPYVARLPPDSAALNILVERGWGRSWGVYLKCDLALKELRGHLRRLLMARLHDGRTVAFRYYDPRVLRVYLPTCLPEEVDNFFGPIRSAFMEGDDPAIGLNFTRSDTNVVKTVLYLDPTRGQGE